MHTMKACVREVCILGVAAGCTLLSGTVLAGDKIVTEARRVDTHGLDLTRAADAQTLYARLSNAAWFVCARGMRADLLPNDDVKGCFEKALGDAVRATHSPLVARAYLATHTPQQAAALGIEVPQRMAAQ